MQWSLPHVYIQYFPFKIPEDIFCELVLLAVDHDGHVPLWSAAATAVLDVLDHVREILRFLWQLAARPLQELELFHRPTLFPLMTEEAEGVVGGLKQLVMLKQPVTPQADSDECGNRADS